MLKHLVVSLALTLPVALTVAAVPPAAAAKAKKAKKVRPATKTPAAGKEVVEAAEEAEDRRAPAQFSWTQRSQAVDMDVRADQKRDEAIAKLKKLLPTISDGPQKAELVFRLSEMYWAKAKYLHLSAMRQWDAALEKWHASGNRGAQPKLEQFAEADTSDLHKREALKLYDLLLDKYPNYERKDEVLYNLGSSLYESGDKKKGVEMYWTLIKQFPKSGYTADAWLQLGEHFFNANKLTQAIKAYQEAAETKKPRIYSYALYKLAWCDYNLQEYGNALKKFRGVVEYAKKQKAGLDVAAGDLAERDKIQLLEESLSDMVRAYAHLDAVDDGFEYYTAEIGRDKAYRYLHKLAKLYNQEGKHALEVKSYERLNQEYPYAAEAPANHTSIMNAYAQLGRSEDVKREVRRMIDLYSPDGVWAKQNAGNQSVLDRAFDIVEQELASLVTEKHREAQQTKLVDTYKLARDIYAEYLDKFRGTVNSYKFRFFYAEILFELKEFDKAAGEYALVMSEKPKGEFTKPAAYTAILAWEKVVSGVHEELGKKIVESKAGRAKGALKDLEKIEELKKGKEYAATDLTANEQKLADACDSFVEIAGEDDEVVKVKFKSARLYYIHNQFEEAAKRFGEIIDRWPKDDLARVGGKSIMESFNVREDWSELNQWGRKFRDEKLLMADKDFATKVAEFIEGSSFNEIHFLVEPKAPPLEIADRYDAFVKEFPKSKFAMVGLYNSIVNYDKANFLERAIVTSEKLLKEYKDFKISAADLEQSKREGSKLPEPIDLREKVLFLVGSFYERLAEFEIAANYYEQYVGEFKSGAKRADAYFNAAVLREGLADFDTALKGFAVYVKEFPNQKDVSDINWRMGVILEKKKDTKAALAHFQALSKNGKESAGRKLCAEYKVVKSNLAMNNEREAKAGFESIIRGFQKLSAVEKQEACALEAVGHAAFVALTPEFNDYLAISLQVKSEKDMAKNLIKKLEMVQKLQTNYTKVLEIGQGDYGIASLYRIGFMYQHLAKAIFDTPCPKKLDEDQCMIYQAELQAKAFPLEEKAIEAFDNALKKAYELGLYNDWLAKAQEALRVYEPLRFPEPRDYDLIASEKVFEVPGLVSAGIR